MTQKISGPDGQGRPVSVTDSAPTARSRAVGQDKRSEAQASRATKPQIEITSAARQLAALEKSLSQIPVVDETRVKTVTAALADGQYQVDAEKIADRLLRSDAELREARRRER